MEEVTTEEWLAPTMKTKPKAQQVTEGETVHFESTLKGKPQPEVRALCQVQNRQFN